MFEYLLPAIPLHNSLRHYLVACLVKGKSPATVNVYRHTIGASIDYALAHSLPVETTSTEVR